MGSQTEYFRSGNPLELNPSCWKLCRRLPVLRKIFFKEKSSSMPVSPKECHGQPNGILPIWKSLGTKSELLEVVSSITGIEEDFLQGKELEYASISKRMSWAAKRNTSDLEIPWN